MAAGRPIICTDVADNGQFIRDNEIGLTARDDPEELAEITLKLMQDEVAQEKMGRHGRHVIETEYAGPVVTAQLDKFYQHILNN